MKYLCKSVILLCFILPVSIVSANQDKAKTLFLSANASYENKKYDDSIYLLKKIKKLLGSSNARISSLEVKIYTAKNNIPLAKKSLDEFYKYKASPGLLGEMTTYITKIEKEYGKFDRIKSLRAIKQFLFLNPGFRSEASKRKYHYVVSYEGGGNETKIKYNKHGDKVSECFSNGKCKNYTNTYYDNGLLKKKINFIFGMVKYISEFKYNRDYIMEEVFTYKEKDNDTGRWKQGSVRKNNHTYKNNVLSEILVTGVNYKGASLIKFSYFDDGGYEKIEHNMLKDGKLGTKNSYSKFDEHGNLLNSSSYNAGKVSFTMQAKPININKFGDFTSYLDIQITHYNDKVEKNKKKFKYDYKKKYFEF